MSIVILGIDPGSRNLGYSVLQLDGNRYTALRCDVLRLAHMDDHSERLQYIFDYLTNIIQSCNPIVCAIETPVYGKDPLAMLKLGRAQAAAMLAATSNNIPVIEYYPKTVKKAVTGRGNAGKEQVAFMLRKVIHLPDEKLSPDATDALAVAWCHLMRESQQMNGVPVVSRKKHQNRKSSDWSEFVRDNPERIR